MEGLRATVRENQVVLTVCYVMDRTNSQSHSRMSELSGKGAAGERRSAFRARGAC